MPALHRVTLSAAVAAGIAVAAATLPAHANDYPTKPVRIIVPFTQGGGTDVVARLIAHKLHESWGQPVVIENRTGGGGTIGAHIVAKATPDGYTLLVSSPAFAISAALSQSLPYDPVKDFAGVTRVGFGTSALIVPPSLGVKTVPELIALAHTRPNQLIFSHAGVGTSTYMNGTRFQLAAGIKVKSVGFKGGADAGLEVVAGRVHFAVIGLTSTISFIRDGRLIALAVNTPERAPSLPDVPTIAEVLPGFERDGSTTMLAPAGTPKPILARISREVGRILQSPDIKKKLAHFDFVAAPCTPEEHDNVMRADIETFAGVVRLAGLRGR